jgi:hypothetical protein
MKPYTELNCAFSLKSSTPDQIVDVLLFMTGQDNDEPPNLPAHPLFSTRRWQHLLRSTSTDDELYACGIAGVELSRGSGRYCVTIRCNFVNCGEEVALFIDWLNPYILAKPGDFLGYTRSQDTEPLTLLFYPNHAVTIALPDEVDGEPA